MAAQEDNVKIRIVKKTTNLRQSFLQPRPKGRAKLRRENHPPAKEDQTAAAQAEEHET